MVKCHDFVPKTCRAGTGKVVVLLVLILIQALLIVWVHRLTSQLRKEWPQVVEEFPSQVYVVQTERFWGPVTVIVPKRCREIDKWQSKTNTNRSNASSPQGGDGHGRTEEEHPGSNTSQLSNRSLQKPSELQSKSLTLPSEEAVALIPSMAPHMEIVTVDEPFIRRLKNKSREILVKRCNETMHFQSLGTWRKYLSMRYVSSFFGHFIRGVSHEFNKSAIGGVSHEYYIGDRNGGMEDADHLRQVRVVAQYALIFGIIVCMMLKYTLVIGNMIAYFSGHKYAQLWNMGRTTFDKILESFLLHAVAIIYSLAMQMTLCGLFLTFWREDHFVMSFLPGVGFTTFGFTLLMFCVYLVIDRFHGFMLTYGNCYIYGFWFCWILWMAALTVPMIGYCVYSVDFMLRVVEMHWVQDEGDIFSTEFATASMSLAKATGGFMVVAVMDFLAILLVDLDII